MTPWEEIALMAVGKASIVYDEALDQCRRNVAAALAQAYADGFAQGRLAEIDLERAKWKTK